MNISTVLLSYLINMPAFPRTHGPKEEDTSESSISRHKQISITKTKQQRGKNNEKIRNVGKQLCKFSAE